jgi:rod shape determining protein RodA
MPIHTITKSDLILTLSTLFLLGLGLTILSSVAPELMTIQVIASFIGIIAFVTLSIINYQTWSRFSILLYLICLAFLISPFILGIPSGGAYRWLQFGSVSIQPSEIARPLLLVIIAKIIATDSSLRIRDLVKSVVVLAIPAYIIFRQPDLGLTLTLIIGWLGILLTKGLSAKQILVGILIVVISLPIGWNILQGYQKDRILTFLNPGQDPLNTGYHVLQSQIAVGSGQLFGRGLGRGTQSHLRFLPERHTDFVFASLAEELGLLGSALVLVLYGILLSRFIRGLQTTQSEFARLIIAGFLATLSFQIFVNIGMNIGLLPITGVTLPLLSYGGSSIISTFITLGIVNNILIQSRGTKGLHIH